MARTKASVGAKISSGKSSKARCSAVPTTSTGISSGGSDKSRGSGGGNPVCPRETPKWQKPITNFFITKQNESQDSVEDGEAAGSSKPKSKKRNIIESSDDDTTPEKPKNKKPDTEKPDLENPNIENPDTETPDVEKPKNNVLDETIELQPLTGENSHKIQEYYPKGAKGKGKGKKTKETKDIESKGEKENEDDVIDVDENSNDSNKTDKETIKGKGIGKKSKEIKDVASNGVEEKINEKVEDSNNIDKENIDINIETSDKDDTIVGRKKREREDRIEEEGNISKKIKVN